MVPHRNDYALAPPISPSPTRSCSQAPYGTFIATDRTLLLHWTPETECEVGVNMVMAMVVMMLAVMGFGGECKCVINDSFIL